MIERRQYPRRSVRSEVLLGQDGVFTRTQELLCDLSEGGAFVETTQQFAIGTILNIRFTLPNAHRPVSTTVAVRNLRGGTGLGVQFLDLSAEDRLSVRDFLAREAEVAEEFLNKIKITHG